MFFQTNRKEMFRIRFTLICTLLCSALVSCDSSKPSGAELESPGKNIKVQFSLTDELQPAYRVLLDNKDVISTSTLGFDFKDLPALKSNLEIVDTKTSSCNEKWELPWGEKKNIVNNYNELIVKLKEKQVPNRLVNLIFRAYDDGIAFQYEFPEQPDLKEVIIVNENTEFQLTGNHDCWWSAGDWDTYEHPYNGTKVSAINAFKFQKNTLANSHIVENSVNPPFTLKTSDGVYISLLEACIMDYAASTLAVDTSTFKLKTSLVGSDRLGYKARKTVPFKTPWRTVQIAKNAGDLIESNILLNLNEPNKLGDVSYVKPMKYVGIWWEMHLGKSSWDLASGKHGATTENTKHYIDFAAKNKLGGVLVEGWNTGWERWIGFPDREGVFDFVTPYKDYKIEEIVQYAKSKGVEIIIHNETSSAPRTYEKQLDTAFAMYNKLGIHAIKTGYVGPIIPGGEYHHGQWMVNHYQKVVEKAAENKIAVNVHEPVVPSGLRRTYPNLISGEGLRGQEFNAWSADGGNPPNHLTIVPFTRMLAGPIDFTPGIFNMKLKPYKTTNQVNTTLAHQLATYVIIYSPIQMAADLVDTYEGHPAFQFVRDVGVDWEESKVLNAEIGQFITMARKERNTDKWFVGSLTNEQARSVDVKFDFLDGGKKYKAILYRDGDNAHWSTKPEDYKIEEMEVDKNSSLTLSLKEGGGAAISLIPVTP
jgi:glucan 1,4-alpha-glucosidase